MTNYADHIRLKLSEMHNKTMHEEIYRILDSLEKNDEPSVVYLDNLVGKIDKLCRENYGLRSQNRNLKYKTDRIF